MKDFESYLLEEIQKDDPGKLQKRKKKPPEIMDISILLVSISLFIWAIIVAFLTMYALVSALSTSARAASFATEPQEPAPVETPAEPAGSAHTRKDAEIRPIPEPEEPRYSLIIENATVTHYDACLKCCGKTDGITASGRKAVPGYSIAVDPALIELGSTVYADYGDGVLVEYRADDVGGAIAGAHIDVCVEDHQTALNLGVREATIYVKE